MSKACKETFNEVTGTTNSDCIHEVIYPLIPKNSHVSQEQIRLKTNNRVVKFLYIAQGERFLSKGAMEVINAFQMLIKEKLPVRLTLVTNIHKIHPSLLSRIRKDNNIQLYDFKFGYQEMEQLYADHDVFLQPSSDDSFGLTVLEAMHAGKALITSKLYAFPEMVEHGVNGFLVEPHYWFFTPENIPNPKVWNHRRKTIYSGQISSRLTEELYTYMKRLVTDRDLLIEMSLASYAKANSAPFSEEYIVSQWNKLINQMVV